MRRYKIDPGKKAAAISYDPDEAAPLLLAAGRGREALRILEEARKAGITIVEDSALAALLEAAKPGDYIPEWCWDAVAKILAFVFAKETGWKSDEKNRC